MNFTYPYLSFLKSFLLTNTDKGTVFAHQGIDNYTILK